MKKVTSVFLCCFLFIALNYAQSGQVMTLKECIEMGIANNLSLQNKNLNVQKSKYGISENRFKLLPVINAFANFTNSPEPAVSVTDGSKYGTPYNVTKTLRYNANGGLQLQLPLYNQTLYTSITISELVNRIDLLSYEKAKEDLIVEIGKLYFLGQTTICQLQIIEGNIARLDSLRNITQAFFDNGMAMDVDVKRVEINLENMRVQYHNAQAMLNQQLNLLKYTLDLPSEYEITLTPLNPDITGNVRFNGLSDSLYELQLLDTQTQLLKKQGRIINQGYIPSLNFTSQLAYSAYTDKFKLSYIQQMVRIIQLRPVLENTHLRWSEQTHQKTTSQRRIPKSCTPTGKYPQTTRNTVHQLGIGFDEQSTQLRKTTKQLQVGRRSLLGYNR